MGSSNENRSPILKMRLKGDRRGAETEDLGLGDSNGVDYVVGYPINRTNHIAQK